MGRLSVLHNPRKQRAVLHSISEGYTLADAARTLGISGRSLRRFMRANPEFAAEVDKARRSALGKERPISAGVAETARIVQRSIEQAVKAGDVFAGTRTSDGPDSPDADANETEQDHDGKPNPPQTPPSERTIRANGRAWSRGGIHPDLDMRSLEAGPRVPELIDWLWDVSRGLVEGTPDSVRATAVRKLCDVKFDPLLAELKLQQMVAARRRERAEEAQDVTEASLVILEIPSNGTEAPGYAPRSDGRLVVDAEVVE